uniref:Ribosomal protein L34Ae n=1 Tax=Salix viminalis TaxID=40686 RepID=A0A6N2NGD8_SALVM
MGFANAFLYQKLLPSAASFWLSVTILFLSLFGFFSRAMIRVKSDKSLEVKEPEVEVSEFKGIEGMDELEEKERPGQKQAEEPEVGVCEFKETNEADELEEKETPNFFFKFQFQTYREEGEPAVLSSVPPTSTNKYGHLSEKDFSHYLEEPEDASLAVKELHAGSNGEFLANKEIMEDGVLSDKGFAEKESEAESVREEIKEISADSVRAEYDVSRDDDAPFLTEEDFILSDSIISSHEFRSRYVASTSDGFLSDKDFKDVFELGILNGQTAEPIDENSELQHLNLNSGYEADGFDGEDSDRMEGLKKMEEAVQNPAKVEEDTEMLSDKDSEDNKKCSKKEHGCKQNEARYVLEMPKCNSQNSSAADSEDSNGLETLWEHQDLIEQLKMELKKVRATGLLPTIVEEDESPKIMEYLKPWKIDEKFQHEDRMGELHKFYRSYSERMRKFDILNYQKMYAMSFLQSKDPLQSMTRREAPAPALTSLLSQKFLLGKRKKSGSDPMVSFIRELHNDLEVVYVGQLCLSWEILHWQYEKALELWDSDPYGMRLYNEVAGEFQQFQVLLQRFIENEPFEGPRVQSYIKNRCVLRNLLQVPLLREDSMKGKRARRKGKDGDSITGDMLVEIMEESIRIFWQFLRSDKDAENVISKGRKGTQIEPQDATERELLTEVRTSLQKKEKRLKDISRSGSSILRKFQKHQGDNSDQVLCFFSQVDINLVSRVLNMSKVTTDQLLWCRSKLSKINFISRKIHVEHSFLLFPC